MSDWQPQVTVIKSITKHPAANALEIATVWDYPVCIKIGQYKVGDLVGYLPIDTIVPDTDMFYFLCPKAYEKYEDEQGVMQQRQLGPKYPVGQVPEKYRRIKAKKMVGIYSQGMLVDCQPGLQIGDSLVDVMSLKKWEEEEEENLPGLKKTRGTNAESPPKGWIMPHYDVDGIRKYVECLLLNEEIVLTEKIHGSNAGFSHDGERLWVKSRNWYKKQNEDDMWWDVALRYDLANKLAQFPNKVFFGEVYGQVKGFRYDTLIEGGRLLTKVRFFDIWDTKTMRYLDYDDFMVIIKLAGLTAVPELYRGGWMGKEMMYPYAEGTSTLNPKHVREGWVLRTAHERYEPRLDSRMQVKLVGEGYNLQK
jgi:RNA ligase (TIGR02306 family)